MNLTSIIETVKKAAYEGRDLLILGPVNTGGDDVIATLYSAFIGGPFRSPHHSIGDKGAKAEASLSQDGVLFLCDIAEFHPRSLERIEQRGQVVASSNLCSCGQYPQMDKCFCRSIDPTGQGYTKRLTKYVRAFFGKKLPITITLTRPLDALECGELKRLRENVRQKREQ